MTELAPAGATTIVSGMELITTDERIYLDLRAEDRVRARTPGYVNAKIDRATEAALQSVIAAGRDAMIARLKDLDREWDVDRALMANFAVIGGAAFELGKRVHPGFHWFLRVQLGFMLHHAIAGWCPPLPVFRRLGFRTAKEIAAERDQIMKHLEAGAPGHG